MKRIFLKSEGFLNKYSTSPAIAFPQYQIFTPDRYQLKTKICLALNKKEFPEIKLNGGGDLVLPTLNGKLIEVSDVPNVKSRFINMIQHSEQRKSLQKIVLDLQEHGNVNLEILAIEEVVHLNLPSMLGFQ